MSQSLVQLRAAHIARRAHWNALAKYDPGIDLKRIPRDTKVRIMPWVAPEEAASIQAYVAGPPAPLAPIGETPVAVAIPEPTPVPVPPKLRFAFQRLKRLVADHYGITIPQLCGPSRVKPLVRPRQVAMYLAHVVLGKSYPETGRQFGGRDHTRSYDCAQCRLPHQDSDRDRRALRRLGRISHAGASGMNQRPAPDAISAAEPVYTVRLLPEIRDAMESYAREQGIPVSVAIAEACRCFAGVAE